MESTLLLILVVHFLADFSLQTNDQAVKKSESLEYLCYHTGAYSLIWLLASNIILNNWLYATYFAVITFVAHTLTDYITSRIGKPFWKKQDLHHGFVVVGFDQMLHYLQLYYTFKLFL